MKSSSAVVVVVAEGGRGEEASAEGESEGSVTGFWNAALDFSKSNSSFGTETGAAGFCPSG